MVKKQNNNAWIVYLIALIAIVALILGAVAVYKANMTGNNIWSWLNDFGNKGDSPDATGGTGAFGGRCVCSANNSAPSSDCSDEKNAYSCGLASCGQDRCRWEGYGGNQYGMLGEVYLANGGNFEDLKGYEAGYGPEGNLLYEIFGGGDQPQGCIDDGDCKNYNWHDCNGDGVGETRCREVCKPYVGGKDCGPGDCCDSVAME